jgi:hypothetical protein
MAEVGKRPHPDFDASQALVKRQKTDEAALIVGSVTKDVSWANRHSLRSHKASAAHVIWNAYCSVLSNTLCST